MIGKQKSAKVKLLYLRGLLLLLVLEVEVQVDIVEFWNLRPPMLVEMAAKALSSSSFFWKE